MAVLTTAAEAPVAAARYLYIGPRLDVVGVITNEALAATTERHSIVLDVGVLTGTARVLDEIERHSDIAGVVIGLASGLPDRARLEIAQAALARGTPRMAALAARARGRDASTRSGCRVCSGIAAPSSRWSVSGGRFTARWRAGNAFGRVCAGYIAARFRFAVTTCWHSSSAWSLDARPIPFRDLAAPPTSSSRLAAGLYLRTDFWARFTSGGSYGHTCYVAKELAALTERFVVPACRSATICSTPSASPGRHGSADDDRQRGRDRQRVDPLLSDRQDRVRGASARIHLRAPVSRQLRRRAR